jgi:hypothetical protein
MFVAVDVGVKVLIVNGVFVAVLINVEVGFDCFEQA